ncbi:hypothetical protein AAG906_035521 [Vitis piasezkii]
MESVGGLFCTSRSPSHGSTSRAPTDGADTVYSSTYRAGELPTETIPPASASHTSAPPVSMLEAVSTAPPMTLTVSSVAPTTSEPSIIVFASEFRSLPDLPTSSEPLAPVEDTILAEDTTTTEVQIPPPQETTIDAIASIDPHDEPQIVDIATTTPDDALSPPEAPTT